MNSILIQNKRFLKVLIL